MTQCWSEGELRAYLDGELPSRDMDRVEAHLKECDACGGLLAELEVRAELVAGCIQTLPEPPLVRVPPVPRRAPATGRWVASAAGIAAALVLGVMFAPRHVDKAAILPPPHGPAVAAPAPPPATVQPAIIRRAPPPRAVPPKPKPQIQYYMALDDEPIETGLVVRVGLDGGQVPADVIVGPDGRARAIRLVSDFSGEAK